MQAFSWSLGRNVLKNLHRILVQNKLWCNLTQLFHVENWFLILKPEIAINSINKHFFHIDVFIENKLALYFRCKNCVNISNRFCFCFDWTFLLVLAWFFGTTFLIDQYDQGNVNNERVFIKQAYFYYIPFMF